MWATYIPGVRIKSGPPNKLLYLTAASFTAWSIFFSNLFENNTDQFCSETRTISLLNSPIPVTSQKLKLKPDLLDWKPGLVYCLQKHHISTTSTAGSPAIELVSGISKKVTKYLLPLNTFTAICLVSLRNVVPNAILMAAFI